MCKLCEELSDVAVRPGTWSMTAKIEIITIRRMCVFTLKEKKRRKCRAQRIGGI